MNKVIRTEEEAAEYIGTDAVSAINADIDSQLYKMVQENQDGAAWCGANMYPRILMSDGSKKLVWVDWSAQKVASLEGMGAMIEAQWNVCVCFDAEDCPDLVLDRLSLMKYVTDLGSA